MSLRVPNYETLEEAQTRLKGTVVLYDGDPVFITNVTHVQKGDPAGDVWRVYANPLPYKGGRMEREEADQFRRFISSRKFEMGAIPLGFMNLDGEVYELSRAPVRQWRQGLTNHTLVVIGITAGARNLNLNHILDKKELVDCIKGNYPPFAEACRKVQAEPGTGCAFGREFAVISAEEVDDLTYVMYRGRKFVGQVVSGRVILNKKTAFLRESLLDLGVDC